MKLSIEKMDMRKELFIASDQDQYKINSMTDRITPKNGNNPGSNRLPYHTVSEQSVNQSYGRALDSELWLRSQCYR